MCNLTMLSVVTGSPDITQLYLHYIQIARQKQRAIAHLHGILYYKVDIWTTIARFIQIHKFDFIRILLLLWSLRWVQMVGYVLAWISYSFICTLHHLMIIVVKTYLKTLNLSNACQIYFVERMIKIRHILSVIHYTIRGAVCFQLTHIPCDDWENIYTLSYYDHQVGSMNHYPLFWG